MGIFSKKYYKIMGNLNFLNHLIILGFILVASNISSYGQYGGSNCSLAQSAPISFTETTPFYHGNDTLFGQGNDYNSINTALLPSFSPTYFNGPDFVYYFTASATGSITIRINYEGAITRHLSVSLFEEAPGFTLGNHISGSYDVISGFSHPGIMTIANVNMGNSYYIVVDGSNTWINMAVKSIYSIEVFYNPVSPPCSNLGFEDGNFDYWYGTSGYIQLCENPLAIHANYYPHTYGISSDQHSIINGGTDLYGGFPCVFEGNYSAMIGDGTGIGGKGAQLINTFEVNSISSFFTLNYAMVVDDGEHEDSISAFIKINMFDQSGLPISCGDYLVIAGGEDEGVIKSPLDSLVSYCQWQSVTTDLSAYIGQNVTIMVTVGDCSELGHFAYAYFDCSCSSIELETFGCNPLNLSAPPGFDFYLWSPGGETSQTIENISEGTYCCELVQNTCTLNVCKEVIIEPLTHTLTHNNSDCAGIDNGSANVTVNGIPPFSFVWSDGSSLVEISTNIYSVDSLSEGLYYLSITDGLGCLYIDSVQIQHNYSINTNFVVNQNVSCYGLNDGSATVFVDNLHPPYTFSWPDSTQLNYNLNLESGSSIVSISDNLGCTSSVEIEITQPEELIVLLYESDSTSCFTACNGFAHVSVSGGTSPYFYLWENGETDSLTNALCTGINTVVVTDSHNCIDSLSFAINSPDSIFIIDNSITNVSCYGYCNGNISIDVSGGITPYSYEWTNGDDSIYSDSLCPGLVNVTITDANLCASVFSYAIEEPDPLQVSINQIDISCYGETNGIIDLTVIGGVAPYSYLWNDSLVTEDLMNIPSGDYSVTISDANSCTYSSEIEISSPAPLIATIEYSDLLCYGDFSGQISISNITGGTTPYSFIWSTGDTTAGITGLSSGLYYLTIYDSNDCMVEISQLIKEPTQLEIGLPNHYSLCNEEFVIIDPLENGGTPEYYYHWSTGSSDSLILVYPVEAGLYLLTITDANGCMTYDSILIGVHPGITFEAFASNDIVCPNIPVTISGIYEGGTGGPYTITLNDSVVELPLIYYPSGTDTLILVVNDSCSNTASDTVVMNTYTVNMPDLYPSAYSGCQPLEIEFILDTTCAECTYFWHITDGSYVFESTEPTLNHIFEHSGNYSLELYYSNEYGCVDSLFRENFISVFPIPEADFHPNPSVMDMFHALCTFYNQSEGASQYYWNFGDGNTSNLENPEYYYSTPGSFWVELVAISDNGCTDTTGLYVIVNEIFTFYAPTAITLDKNNINDVFRVLGTGIDEENFNLYIYDRWGEQIFHSENIMIGWDGKVKNGDKIAPIGSYVWLSTFKDFMGNSHEYSGIVTIIK